jgi:hypothetical protein
MATKLTLSNWIVAADSKNYTFYSKLSDQDKKSFGHFVLMRMTSNCSGDKDLQEWFIEMTNEAVNKHHWTISKHHKELIWLLYTTTGVGCKVNHPYLAAGKNDPKNKIEKLLCELEPATKLSDIKLKAKLMSAEEIENLLDGLGYDKQSKKDFR